MAQTIKTEVMQTGVAIRAAFPVTTAETVAAGEGLCFYYSAKRERVAFAFTLRDAQIAATRG